MNRWKTNRIVFVLLLIMVVGTALWAMSGRPAVPFDMESGNTVSSTGTADRLPTLDRKRPEQTEIALFALG
jgi:hypothetical protein